MTVIDTGVEPVPGLDGADKIVVGPDLSFEAGLPELYGRDAYGHGTVMASIIAGDDGPGGFQGVAPGSRIVSMKVADNTGAVGAARGTSHVTMPDGAVLQGEVTFTGSRWSGSSWA